MTINMDNKPRRRNTERKTKQDWLQLNTREVFWVTSTLYEDIANLRTDEASKPSIEIETAFATTAVKQMHLIVLKSNRTLKRPVCMLEL